MDSHGHLSHRDILPGIYGGWRQQQREKRMEVDIVRQLHSRRQFYISVPVRTLTDLERGGTVADLIIDVGYVMWIA